MSLEDVLERARVDRMMRRIQQAGDPGWTGIQVLMITVGVAIAAGLIAFQVAR